MVMSSQDLPSTRVVRNPGTGEPVGEVPINTREQLEAALERSAQAQRGWANVPRHERAALMKRYVAVLREHHEELATLLSKENGKPISQARDEIGTTERIFEGFAERVLQFHEEARFLDSQPGLERDVQITRHEPLGVIGAIVPYNFPSELQAWKVAPAIAMGNTVVVKPASATPLTGAREVELMDEVGFPPGVVQMIHGPADIARALAEHPIPAGISLTGSTEAGLSVAASGAKTLKRVELELGGNDAMIVLADADLDRVVAEAVFGRSLANGQVCCATKRILVQRPLFAALLERLNVEFGGLRVGDQLADGTQIGPLISSRAADEVAEQVRTALGEGARLIVGGQANEGAFFRPTVIVDEEAASGVSHSVEIFGPVLDIVPFDAVERAVEIANSSIFGLSGSVFSRDIGRAMDVALQMQTGAIVINGTGLYRSDAMAWGGYKLSGNVREGLGTSLEDFAQTKTLTLRRILSQR
jgi:succinate-semialdehyde dehydrogenase / glutarate-semialdehyde dehydrogenase